MWGNTGEARSEESRLKERTGERKDRSLRRSCRWRGKLKSESERNTKKDGYSNVSAFPNTCKRLLTRPLRSSDEVQRNLGKFW